MSRYLYAEAENRESESARLAHLDRFHRECTERALTAAGVGAGWHCWDVGAGAGGVSRLLRDMVSSTGSVLATDIDLTLLTGEHALEGVLVRRHDLMRDDITWGGLDLAHCRLLLMHLADPETAVRRLLSSLRPGGALVVSDIDFTGVTDVSGASDAVACWAALGELFRRAGADTELGPRLPGIVTRVGLRSVEAEFWGCHVHGGTDQAEAARLSVLRNRDAMVSAGLVSESQLESGLRQFREPEAVFTSPTIWSVRARAPEYF